MSTHDSSGIHHFHRRKRIYQKHEPYPHPDKFKAFMDKVIYFVSIVGPLMALPQALSIWINQNAGGVSIISWSAFFVLAGIWVVYGFLHKEKPIIVMNLLWMIIDLIVVIEIIVY